MQGFEYNNKLIIAIGIIVILITGGSFFLLKSSSKTPDTTPPIKDQATRETVTNNLGNVNFIQPQNKTAQNKKDNDFSFTAQERPAFQFPSVAYASDIKEKTIIYNSDGTKVDANLSVNKNGNGSVIALSPSTQFTPGKYTMVVNENGKKISQDFTWGVLAINTNKSIYTPEEIALLSLAVLNEKGKMVCDAKVTLTITDPTGHVAVSSTDNGLIKVNKDCFIKGFTTKPDYEADYKVQDPGIYQMELTAVTKKGNYQIQDSFIVQNSVDFDVERITATRTFPSSVYPVEIKITANRDFSGQIKELVPSTFAVNTLDNTVAYNNKENKDGFINLYWNVSLKKGQNIIIGYRFKSPEISPQFYLLGPLSFISAGTTIFEEQRTWQLAIDATYSSVILADSPIGYWRLGEPSGTNAADSSTAAHNGTYVNTPTLGVTGALTGDSDTAVTFAAASSQTVDIASVADFGAGPVSFEAWFKQSTTSSTDKGILSRGGTALNRWFFFRVGSTHTVKFGTGSVSIDSTGIINDTNWHHVIGTKDATTTGFKVYIDGADAGGTPPTFTTTSNTGNVTIGVDVASDFMDGTLDEVAIYSVALSPSQVLTHYNAGLGIFTSSVGDFLFQGLRMQGLRIN